MECLFQPTESGNPQYICKFCNKETPLGQLYPYPPRRNCASTAAIEFPQGVGIELKRLLRKIGITPKTGCKCKDHAKQMDDLGVEWCSQNVETIADWMQEEAKERKMPFLRVGAKILVKKAIRNARRKEKFLQ